MTETLMERLKADTRPFHDQTEGHPFQKALFGGSLPLRAFVDYLSQLLIVHSALENALNSFKSENSIAAKIIEDHQMQVGYLTSDLESLDASPSTVQPTPGTKELVALIESSRAERPFALLGFHYVLFGSKHGGKMLAKHLQQIYGFGAGENNRTYFDPYGSSFMEYWLRFKASMNEAALSPAQQEDVVQGARDMFKGMSWIFDDLETVN